MKVTSAASGRASKSGGGAGSLAADDPVGEREDGRCHDEVQGQKEKCVLFTEPNRDTERGSGEQHHRDDGRVAHEGNCSEKGGNRADTHQRKPGRLGEEESKVVVTDERTPDAGRRQPE